MSFTVAGYIHVTQILQGETSMANNTRAEARAKIAEYLRNHPEVSFKELALTLDCSISTIATIARQHGVVRQRKALTTADTVKLEG
jgi:hypothetical protein